MLVSHPIPGYNRNHYYFLLLTSFDCFRALTIPFEVQAIQDIIHSLMNHALTFDHSSGPVCVNPLDDLE